MPNNPNNPKKSEKILNAIANRDSHEKTVLVSFEVIKIDSLYKKRTRSFRKLLVHTESPVTKGQQVLISPIRPVSKRKAWQVVKVQE